MLRLLIDSSLVFQIKSMDGFVSAFLVVVTNGGPQPFGIQSMDWFCICFFGGCYK